VINRLRLFSLSLLLLCYAPPARAQLIESVGSRALGMGGAFVAVASDSTATWWNPAALAAGPFVDVAIATAVTEQRGQLPGSRDHTSWFTLGTPPFGFSYYRFRVTNIAGSSPTVAGLPDRQVMGTGVPLESLSVNQLGVTLDQSIVDGIHIGTTLKYVRGTVRSGVGDALADPGALLDQGEDLEGGSVQGRFDLDVGVIGVGGPLRVGAVARNLTEPEFRAPGEGVPTMRLPRQVRVGVAYDAAPVFDVPLTIAVDADVRSYTTGTGERRAIALGAERWFLDQRLGIRAGGRFNTVGAKERTATAGVSYAVRSGLFLEGHVVRGGSTDERGWGAAARVSF
jgi:hypothetical protein